MLFDLEKFDKDIVGEADVCIVGGGAVGLVMAVQLSRMGKRIILLEGGGIGLEDRSQALHRIVTAGHPSKLADFGRYRVLGGTTAFWGGQVVPLEPIVFEDRPWVTDTKWGFEGKELDAHHLKAFELIGLKQVELDDRKIWERIGVDPDLGPDVELIMSRWVPRRNFARVFKKEIESGQNLQTFLHANVTGFSLDETGRRISAVQASSFNGRRIEVRAKQTVLACGTIEITRLLLQESGNGVPYPWEGNPWIGRGFIDHIDSYAGTVRILDKTAFHNMFDSIIVDKHRYFPRIHLLPDTQRKDHLLDIAGHFAFDSITFQHLVNIKMFVWSIIDGRMPPEIWKLPGHILAVLKIAAPIAYRYMMDHRLYKPAGGTIYLQLTSEQFPNPESCIRLTDEKDELGMRHVAVDWRFDGREIKTFAAFSRFVRDALLQRGIAEITLDADLDAEDPAFFGKVFDGNHHMSTTRIGASPDEGVVNSNLRIHGTDNLYIAGAAVFPSTGFANSTLTAIALGLRLCDHLAKDAH